MTLVKTLCDVSTNEIITYLLPAALHNTVALIEQ